MMFIVLFALSWSLAKSEYYSTFSGKPISAEKYAALQRLKLVPYCAIEIEKCDANAQRPIDGSCNNLKHPTRGATLTPYRRLLQPIFSQGGGLRTSSTGKPLPLVRPLRVAVMSDGRRSSDRFTQMVVNYNVFITGDITSVHDTVNYVLFTNCCTPDGRRNPNCMPVEVKDNDLHLRRSNIRCLNLTRAITYQRLGCVSKDIPPERVNTATPLLDLSEVYGHIGSNARRGREGRGGRLKAELLNGKEWPPSGGQLCVLNEPPRETRCHQSPSAGANSILGLNLLSIWFYRNHNAIAHQLQALNPCWDDERLYHTAREVNIAYYVHIMYYEMMTELLGLDFLVANKVVFPGHGHVDDYNPELEPRVSIEYVNAYRWFHTLQEGRLKLYTKDGRQYDEVSVVDFTLRTGALPLNHTIDGMTQGVFRQPGAGVDDVLDPDVGERILGKLQLASDVVSSDIMKSRDMGLPPYNNYRKLCGLPEAKTFEDLLGWMNKPQVEAIASFYESPADIDIGVAFLVERPMPGGIVGPTMACIMAEQLKYWRQADRFWFENRAHPGSFSEEQLYEIRKITMGKLICQHGDGVDATQPNVFLLPGPGNEIKKCSEYEMPNLYVFRDNRCYPNTFPSYKTQPEYLHQPGRSPPPSSFELEGHPPTFTDHGSQFYPLNPTYTYHNPIIEYPIPHITDKSTNQDRPYYDPTNQNQIPKIPILY